MKAYIRICIIPFVFSAFLLMTACAPPMRFSQSMDVPSPDGETTLEANSVTWTNFGLLIGPEPPRTSSCIASISGWALLRATYFKINIDANFKYSTSALDHIDVSWSPDSKFFAVISPLDMTVYDKNGNVISRYDLGTKQRVSSVHWKKDEGHGLYFVVKGRGRDLLPLETFFEPLWFKILYLRPGEKACEMVYSRNYFDCGKSDSFVRNDLGARKSGQEFQEISPESRYFIYGDEKKIRYYDFKNRLGGALFDYTGRLTWIWWVNKNCILLNITREKDQYIIYNIITGEQRDLTRMILSLPTSKRYTQDWYKSIECP